MNNFAKWLQDELNKRDWSQSDLARKTGLTRSAISYILGSKSKNPDNKTLALIANVFDVPLEEVITAVGLTDKTPPSSVKNIYIKRIVNIVEQLPPEEQEGFYELAKLWVKTTRKI